ncbi:GMC family oxidoreductase [Sporobolomyces koalae]|uniref:GMC family oxidoreductase n=1 Tax=Sporobolomyces koalae TaxID=500713 RepID=UPI003179583B
MLSTLLVGALLLASSSSAATILDLTADAAQVSPLLAEPVDYVVVGGGNAGLAVAARLAQSKKNYKVVVLEAGHNDPTNTGILVPGLAGSTLGNTSVDWAFSTVPQEHADGRSVFTPRGKTLGGSSALNFLVYTRPDAADLDEWEKFGNKGWNWQGLLPYFKKAEKFYPPVSVASENQAVLPKFVSAVHGIFGPIDTSYPRYLAPTFNGFFKALRNLGIREAKDLSVGDSNGISLAPSTQHPESATRATSTDYLRLAKSLTVITGAQATKINWQGSKTEKGNVVASGVSFVATGSESAENAFTINVSREVILSAGTIQTPQLLELSGVGDASILEPLGIKSVVDLKGVGANLQDHAAQVNVYKLKDNVESLDELADPAFLQTALGQYARAQGILTEALFPLAYLKLSDFLTKDDLAKIDQLRSQSSNPQLTGAQFSATTNLFDAEKVNFLEVLGINVYFGNSTATANTSYISLAGCLQHSLSRGSVHINSANALSAPLIDPAYLQSPLDLFLLAKSAQFLRKVAAQPALSKYIAAEAEPGLDVQTDAQFEEWIRSVVRTEYHPVGTAAMLPVKDNGVVDPWLSVYGTQNVRVVDLSIVPIHVASHTQSVAYAIAEKGAAIILSA